MQCPLELDKMPLIQSTQMYSYIHQHKKEKWLRRKQKAIVNVHLRFKEPPNEDNKNFEIFCRSKLLIYKPFHNILINIGVTKEKIISNWRLLKATNYYP